MRRMSLVVVARWPVQERVLLLGERLLELFDRQITVLLSRRISTLMMMRMMLYESI